MDHELWSGLVSAQVGDWAVFRTDVMALYPGADNDRQYGVADLTRLTARYASYGIQTRAELGEYYREFIRITDYLIAKQRLSGHEWDIAYEQGFDEDLKSRIKTRLQYSKPDHFHDEPYGYKTLLDYDEPALIPDEKGLRNCPM